MSSLRKKVDAAPASADVTPRQGETPKLQDSVAASPSERIDAKQEEAAQAEIKRQMEATQRAADMVSPQPAEPEEEPEAHEQEEQLEQAIANMPERVQGWIRKEPKFLTDPERAAQMQYAHHVARRQTGQEFTDQYYDRMEQLLFQQRRQQQPQPSQQQPVRQQQYRGAQVSAPPTREVPSMSTGRAMNYNAPLLREESEIADGLRESYGRNADGSFKITTAEARRLYTEGKQRMLRQKKEGLHPNG
jgi:hypothetical protein